jgi:hypothetical protein
MSATDVRMVQYNTLLNIRLPKTQSKYPKCLLERKKRKPVEKVTTGGSATGEVIVFTV